MRLWLPTLAVFLAFSFFPFGSSRRQRTHGAQDFNTYGCRHCHTVDGVGGQRGPDLSDVGKLMTKSALRRQIVHGGTSMPPFRNVLDRRQLNDLIAYLRSNRRNTGE
ncbi:MAG: c-type cytochrome [Terracidiphilus sp.]